LRPRLTPIPGTIWRAVFAAAAAWFAWQASPAGRRAAGAVALPRAVLAPRLAACYKITMRYLLVTML
jgi:hypothetical protein